GGRALPLDDAGEVLQGDEQPGDRPGGERLLLVAAGERRERPLVPAEERSLEVVGGEPGEQLPAGRGDPRRRLGVPRRVVGDRPLVRLEVRRTLRRERRVEALVVGLRGPPREDDGGDAVERRPP